MSFFEYKNRKVFYQIDGEISPQKKVIVILNGIMMSTQSWEIFKDSFSQDNVLLRFDMFDQGQSSSIEKSYTQDIQVELLKALLDYLKLDKVSIMGISYGASIALQFSVKYEQYIDKLIIANGVAKTSLWLKAIGDGWNEVAKSRNGEAYYNITIPYIYSPEFYVNNIEWMSNRKNVLIPIFSDPTFLDRMIRLTKSAETHDVTDLLNKIETSTLIIASEQDFLTPVFEQELIHKQMKNSHLVVIPSCGHASMYEVPELFTSLVLGFINNNQIDFNI